MNKNSRSPLKDKPLRNPGQSLEERRHELIDKTLESALPAVLLIALAGMEWWRYFYPKPPAPYVYSVLAFGASIYAGYRFWRMVPEAKALRLGIQGERAVGQFLERLREDGYQVFHDLVGDGFNLDHVIIGPAGVFAVETKTHSKPKGREAKVVVSADKLLVDGREPDRNPLIQAKAQASWLHELLHQSTGRRFDVRSVILFPGWFVE